jgi:hypothetical protein
MDRVPYRDEGANLCLPAVRRRDTELASRRSRLAELLILCARIGFNP